MSLFAVTYSYVDDPDALTASRPEHREFLGGLDALVASGPTDANGALLILEAASAEEVGSLLDGDPFHRAGLITERTVVGWNLILGRWADRA